MGGKHAKAKGVRKKDPLKPARTQANKKRRADAIAARKARKRMPLHGDYRTRPGRETDRWRWL